ncbi:sugar fermentation stimulation protein A [Succinivibrio dextrinosolvens]|uniref:DNA/RNA nuclease SfsA n=1 Tax=Succinivibrio dextrinosolvens TaxID=83771 RepID=UPI0008EA5AF3|nr:DNA/RNA nuclease SfsA [Succinivibrio dextrinosolvens]SFS42181.1 sugar fermentation stimulation protein A [Succinivibrio dextrinosolvens]
MQYPNTVQATFLERPNRFIAKVLLNGKTETVHVKNTGRCRELLLPHSKVVLTKSDNPERKTQYDLIAVEKAGLGLVNIDSQAPNALMKEWLTGKFDVIKPEYSYGNSRIDFYLEKGAQKYLVEVKGCTLEEDGIGYFPDAPTQRGVKHIYELIDAQKRGYICALAFVIQMQKVTEVRPNGRIHPEFEKAFRDAIKAGVRIWFLGCSIQENALIPDPNRTKVEF